MLFRASAAAFAWHLDFKTNQVLRLCCVWRGCYVGKGGICALESCCMNLYSRLHETICVVSPLCCRAVLAQVPYLGMAVVQMLAA